MLAPTLMTGLTGLILLLAPAENLTEALEALSAGQELGRVPRRVAAEAAAAITPLSDEQAIRDLSRIARAGEADAELRAALMPLVLERAMGLREALRALGELPLDREVALPDDVRWALQEIARDDPELDVARGACLLIASGLSGSDHVALVMHAVDAGDPPRAAAFLRAAVHTKAPLDLFSASGDVDATLAEPLTETLRTLLAADPATADAILSAVENGDVGPGAAFVAALGAIRFSDAERWERARNVLLTLLAGADDLGSLTIAAALTASSDLLLAEVVALLPGYARNGRTSAVRVAAIRAIAKVCYRDAPTIDLLLELLTDGDGAVAAAAHDAVSKKSGQQMPHRPDLWAAWRARTDLPASAPGTIEDRLAEQRRLKAKHEGRQRARR